MALDTTVSGANANSYASMAEAATYHAGLPEQLAEIRFDASPSLAAVVGL
jgi:hypothetical protein